MALADVISRFHCQPSRISVLPLVFALASAGWACADTLDEQLNAAYQQASASKRIAPEGLKWTELHWITYRDAEANLQAWLSGRSQPDEAARQAILAQLTQVRLEELQHIAQDGTSGMVTDGGDAAHETLLVGNASAAVRQSIIDWGSPDLTSALLLDQKAWLEFSDLQADYDGYQPHLSREEQLRRRSLSLARLYRLRLAQLQADAAKFDITIGPPVSAAASAAEFKTERESEVSPAHDLRIEQPEEGQCWVISNKTGERALLPTAGDEANTGRGKPTVPVSDFAISPDEHWIFRLQKFYHGMNGAYLYERDSGVHFKPATEQPLDILAWKFFQKSTGNADPTAEGVVHFVSWDPGCLRFSLNASKRLTFANVNDWLVDYDLKTKTFSIPPDAIEHDRAAFDPASE